LSNNRGINRGETTSGACLIKVSSNEGVGERVTDGHIIATVNGEGTNGVDATNSSCEQNIAAGTSCDGEIKTTIDGAAGSEIAANSATNAIGGVKQRVRAKS